MSTSAFHVRRVGFRDGTDAELAALHAVEAPVAAECGSNRMPAPLDSYIGFARNLPSQFDDHAWIVETADGVPVAAGFCWSNSAGDERVMECEIFVLPGWRREGIASRLLAVIGEEAALDGRSLLTWTTFDPVPAGEAFSRRVGASAARVNRTSELVLADVDWVMVARWARAEQTRDRGYVLEMVDGAFPEDLRTDAVTFHHIMQTAPLDDLEAAGVWIDGDFVAELDRALLEAGRERWTLLVRGPDGQCVGGTQVIYEPWQPERVHQQNTGIDPAHRGLGLAKWAKATMLERIRQQLVGVEGVQTDNAYSNAPMLAINRALGFKVIGTHTEWQAPIADLLRSIA